LSMKVIPATHGFDIVSLRQRLSHPSSVEGVEKSNEPAAAVAIILDPSRDGGSVLLIKRRDREGDPWSGQIAFPGGHRSASDATLLQTAVRETSEEVGIELNEHDVVGVLPPVYPRTRRVLVTAFVFQLKNNVEVRLNDEVAESLWVPLEVLSKARSTTSEVLVQQAKLDVDSYVYERHVIWGLTFRIINLLLNRS
jgi:8-oxo-dGTP pyrophosphatase MutT (NUDIX family)